MQDKILRFTSVGQAVGLSRSTIWRKERNGTFPPRRQLSDNAVGWLQSEIEAWIDSSQRLTALPAKAAP